MRRRRQLLAYSFLALMGVVVVAFVAASMVTERQRREALASIEKPNAILRVEQRGAATPSGEPSSSSPVPGAPADTISPEEKVTLEAWAALFEELDAAFQREGPWASFPERGRGIIRKYPEKWSTEERTALEAFLKANPELLRHIRTMVDRGGPVYRFDFSSILASEWTSMHDLMDCGVLLHVDALIRGEASDSAGACESIMSGMALAELLREDPTFLGQWWPILIQNRMVDALQATFDWGEIPMGIASQILAYIPTRQDRSALAESLAVERYLDLRNSAALRRMSRAELQERLDLNAYNAFYSRLYFRTRRILLDYQEAAFVDMSTQVIDLCHLPYHEARSAINEMRDSFSSWRYSHPGFRHTLSDFFASINRFVRHEARSDLVRMGLSLERHYQVHGVYPETLDAIAPALGCPLPLDPYTGEPYHYEPADRTFLLYSVGPNLVDDGGTHGEGREGDIVWRGGNKNLPDVAHQGSNSENP